MLLSTKLKQNSFLCFFPYSVTTVTVMIKFVNIIKDSGLKEKIYTWMIYLISYLSIYNK